MPERSAGVLCVLFTDLVGSTELMARIGDVAYDRLRGEHFAHLREALVAHGGVEVKNTGDGVMATFASASAALACAGAMQQAVDRQARSAAVPLAIRVGLSLGEATLEDGDVFGTPVVEAARLVAAARPGQILATAVIKVVAGSRSPAPLTDLGTVALKGLPEPVPVCELAWEPAATAASTIPLPTLLSTTGRLFVGREDELERIGRLWKDAAAGERRVALVSGEPGIGKTRLTARFARAVHEHEAVVLAGRCDEDLGVPYQPFVEALRHYVGHAPEPRLGRHGGELARLVPELPEVVPGLPDRLHSDPETERYRLFDAVAAWLGDVSAEAPVLLVLDDLHWAAKPTLLLLRHVLHAEDPLRLLVAVTYRDSDIGRGHPMADLLADLRRETGVERISLSGLDVPGVASFLTAAAGHELSEEGEDLARAIWAETEGNPFFVGEVLRHLIESGAFEQRDGRWVATAAVEELGIPEGVREVVGRRLSRLSEPANRALAVAAVVGLEFEAAVVLAAGPLDEDPLLAALDDAVGARLLIELPGGAARYRFAHALVRGTLYDELSAARRVALHRKVAEAIEAVHVNRLDDHLPALAHHWARAAAPAAEADRAVEYATRAGDRALSQLAHGEAVAYYRQALELLEVGEAADQGATRLDLLLALGEAERRGGEPAYRATLLAAAELAQQRGDAAALARAALAGSRGMLSSVVASVDQERVSLLQAAVDSLGPAESAVRARLLASLGQELTYAVDLESRIRLSDEALAIARRGGDPATLAEVLTARVLSTEAPESSLSERRACISELIGAADAVGDPVLVAWSRLLRYRTAMQSGDVAEAEPDLEMVERTAEELRQPTLRWYATWARAGRALFAGSIGEAERLVHAADDLAESTGQPDAQLFKTGQLFLVRFEQGRLGELRQPWIEIVGRIAHPLVRGMLALLHAELDERAEAERVYEDFAASEFRDVPLDTFWMFTIPQLAAVAAYLGDGRRAELLHSMLAPYGERIAGLSTVWLGSVSHYLGLLDATRGRYDEAEAHFAAAAGTHERVGASAWLARTRLEWARMLLTRRAPGDTERARDLLEQALGTAAELGLGTVERRSRALLELEETQ